MTTHALSRPVNLKVGKAMLSTLNFQYNKDSLSCTSICEGAWEKGSHNQIWDFLLSWYFEVRQVHWRVASLLDTRILL